MKFSANGGLKSMKKSMECYLVFTSLAYRVIVFFLFPVGLTAGVCLYLKELGAVAAAALLPTAEVMTDRWLFGGIQAGEVKLEYLMTSGRGMGILRRALVLDLVRRFLTAAVVLAACWGLRGASGSGAGMVLFSLLALHFFTTMGIFLSRFWDILWINMVTGEVSAVLTVCSFGLPGLRQYLWGYALFFAAAGILAGILAVKIAVRKVEGGYYGK
jgi:hypothetical protein